MAFVPENDLERVLMRAAGEPAARPEFYRLLLESDLLVLGTVDRAPGATGGTVVQPGDQLKIIAVTIDAKPCHPLFSSMTRLQSYIKSEESFLTLKGRALFEATPGATFLLNPGADYGKMMLPGEIAGLLHPESVAPQRVTLDKPTQVLIGQPSVYPHALVEALKTMFATHADVEAAYLVQIAFSDRDQPPHPMIGVETTGAWETLSAEIGRVAAAAAPGLLFDVSRIDRAKPRETLTAALLKTEPFYRRKKSLWGALFN
jgi:hypothetical protein